MPKLTKITDHPSNTPVILALCGEYYPRDALTEGNAFEVTTTSEVNAWEPSGEHGRRQGPINWCVPVRLGKGSAAMLGAAAAAEELGSLEHDPDDRGTNRARLIVGSVAFRVLILGFLGNADAKPSRASYEPASSSRPRSAGGAL